MVKKRTILFDCGDTLVHLDPPKENIVVEFLHEEGINISIDDVKLAYRIVNFHLKQSSLNLGSSVEKQDFLINYNIQLLKVLGLSSRAEFWSERLFHRFNVYKKWVLFSDVTLALTSFKKQQFLLGVVANWESGLQNLLKQLNIDHLFDLIMSSADAGIEKPSSQFFLLALEKIGAHPLETYYVGNEYEVDVIGARTVGIEPILIDRDNILPSADCLRFTSLLQTATYLMHI